MKLYKLYRIIERDGEDYATRLGIYSSEQNANIAKNSAIELWNQASEHGRFEVYLCELDQVSWTSGFGE